MSQPTSLPVSSQASAPDLAPWAALLQRLAVGDHEVAVPAPGPGPGHWAGAATAILVDSVTYLAYRLRRPVDSGRGYATVVARSQDGVSFETVAEIRREDVGAESLERPVLLPVDGESWRLYLSCATPGSKHWGLESLTACRPDDLARGLRQRVAYGDTATAVKDPVNRQDSAGTWQMWACCHPLDIAGSEDRMATRYATSRDGLRWTDHGVVLRGRPGRWDARGARVTAVLDPVSDGRAGTYALPGAAAVLYDGRPDAASNWLETTGIAVQSTSGFAATEAAPARSSDGDGALRYASVVVTPEGRKRLYAERSRPDGAHDLVTVSI